MLYEGQALVEAGESYRQLAEVKYSMEDNVKQNFLDPLAHIQNKDLKEVNVSILYSTHKFVSSVRVSGGFFEQL